MATGPYDVTFDLKLDPKGLDKFKDFGKVIRDVALIHQKRIEEDMANQLMQFNVVSASTTSTNLTWSGASDNVFAVTKQSAEYHCPECRCDYGNHCKEDEDALSITYTYVCHKCAYSWTETLFEDEEDYDDEDYEETCTDQTEQLQPGQTGDRDHVDCDDGCEEPSESRGAELLP